MSDLRHCNTTRFYEYKTCRDTLSTFASPSTGVTCILSQNTPHVARHLSLVEGVSKLNNPFRPTHKRLRSHQPAFGPVVLASGTKTLGSNTCLLSFMAKRRIRPTSQEEDGECMELVMGEQALRASLAFKGRVETG